jgi:glycosyltransferase
VHVEQWWPQDGVLRQAAAVVSHGGWGTTIGALATATPMVVIPLFALRQYHNAERIDAVGAGVALSAKPMRSPSSERP